MGRKPISIAVPRHNQLSVTLGILLSLPIASAHGAWLNAYGTPGKETSASVLELTGGGYLLLGRDKSISDISKPFAGVLLAKLNAQGDIQWSKKILDNVIVGNVLGDGSGIFDFYQPYDLVDPAKFIWGSGRIDLATGSVSTVFAKSLATSLGDTFIRTQVSNPSADSSDNILVGSLAGSGGATHDAVVAKFDAAGNTLWSHVYDHKINDNVPSLYKFGDGYLMTSTFDDTDPVSGATDSGAVLTKLDGNGNLSGTPVILPQIELSPAIWQLSDGGYLLQGLLPAPSASGSSAGAYVVKLDGNLNYLWGKHVTASSAAETYVLSTAKELADGLLEFTGYRSVMDDVGTETEHRPVLVRLSKNGDLTFAREIHLRTIDAFQLHAESDGYLASGTTANSIDDSNSGGIVARFNGSLDPTWVRSLSGVGVSLLDTNTTKTGFLMDGSTESKGAGQDDLVAGLLDGNGNIPNCPIIGNETPTLVTPNISLLDLGWTLTPATITDKGSFAGVIEDVSFPINATDANLITTPICASSTETPANNPNSAPLSQSAPASPVRLGESFGYTLSYTNLNTADATAVKLTDTIPKTAKLLSATASQGRCKGNATVVCSFGTVTPNTTVTAVLTLSAKKAGTFKNKAVITYKTVKAGTKKKKQYKHISTTSTTVTK